MTVSGFDIGSRSPIKQYIFTLRQLARRDRRRNNSSAVLGQFWQVLNPFFTMIIMALIFSDMLGNDRFANFPIFILTGNLIYSLFNEGTTRCLSALSGNKNFLIKTHIPKSLYVLERVYVAFINFLYSSIIFIILFLAMGEKIKPTFILVIPNVFLMLVLITGIGKILAVINVEFADITYFYKIFTLMVFYGSALFYDTARLSPAAQKVLSLNPVYLSIAISRISIIDGQIPKWTVWFKLAVYAFGLYAIGTHVFKKGSEDAVRKL